jgi:hypothetical protein
MFGFGDRKAKDKDGRARAEAAPELLDDSETREAERDRKDERPRQDQTRAGDAPRGKSVRDRLSQLPKVDPRAMIAKRGNRPAKPRLVLRLAVVGHRLNKLQTEDIDRIETKVADMLGWISAGMTTLQTKTRKVFSDEPIRLVMMSALAEGADRIAATKARGWALEAVLPFPRARAITDFETEASRRDFTAWLDRCDRVMELDEPSTIDLGDAAPYAAAGEVLVRQSDLVLAVWDGAKAAGPGGTADVIAQALRRGRPVIWINAVEDRPTRLLRPDQKAIDTNDETGFRNALVESLSRRIAPPADSESMKDLARFFAEAPPALANAADEGKLAEATDIIGRHAPHQADAIRRILLERTLTARASAAAASKALRLRALAPLLFAPVALAIAALAPIKSAVLPLVAMVALVAIGALLLLRGERNPGARADARASLAASLPGAFAQAGVGGDIDAEAPESGAWPDWYVSASLREVGLPDAVADTSWATDVMHLAKDVEAKRTIAWSKAAGAAALSRDRMLLLLGVGGAALAGGFGVLVLLRVLSAAPEGWGRDTAHALILLGLVAMIITDTARRRGGWREAAARLEARKEAAEALAARTRWPAASRRMAEAAARASLGLSRVADAEGPAQARARASVGG